MTNDRDHLGPNRSTLHGHFYHCLPLRPTYSKSVKLSSVPRPSSSLCLFCHHRFIHTSFTLTFSVCSKFCCIHPYPVATAPKTGTTHHPIHHVFATAKNWLSSIAVATVRPSTPSATNFPTAAMKGKPPNSVHTYWPYWRHRLDPKTDHCFNCSPHSRWWLRHPSAPSRTATSASLPP